MRKIMYLILALAVVSCTVFEDRSDCPCWLNFILDDCGEFTDIVNIHTWNDGTLTSETVTCKDMDHLYEVEVPRGEVMTCVFSDVTSYDLQDYLITVPEGTMPDTVFVHTSYVLCDGEFAYDTVSLHKQWMKVTVKIYRDGVQIKGGDWSVHDSDYGFVVHSNVIGLNMLTLEPVFGELTFVPETHDGSGVLEFNLLRHEGQPEELFMDIYNSDDILIDRMNLGQYFLSAGYDWDEDSLADVEMSIDIVTKHISLVVVPWTDLGHSNIHI